MSSLDPDGWDDDFSVAAAAPCTDGIRSNLGIAVEARAHLADLERVAAFRAESVNSHSRLRQLPRDVLLYVVSPYLSRSRLPFVGEVPHFPADMSVAALMAQDRFRSTGACVQLDVRGINLRQISTMHICHDGAICVGEASGRLSLLKPNGMFLCTVRDALTADESSSEWESFNDEPRATAPFQDNRILCATQTAIHIFGRDGSSRQLTALSALSVCQMPSGEVAAALRDSVVVIDPETGAHLKVFKQSALGIASDIEGNIVVSCPTNRHVRSFRAATGAEVRTYGSDSSAKAKRGRRTLLPGQLLEPGLVCVDAGGSVLVVEDSCQVLLYHPCGHFIRKINVGPCLRITALAVDAEGAVLVACGSTGKIYRAM